MRRLLTDPRRHPPWLGATGPASRSLFRCHALRTVREERETCRCGELLHSLVQRFGGKSASMLNCLRNYCTLARDSAGPRRPRSPAPAGHDRRRHASRAVRVRSGRFADAGNCCRCGRNSFGSEKPARSTACETIALLRAILGRPGRPNSPAFASHWPGAAWRPSSFAAPRNRGPRPSRGRPIPRRSRR